MIKYMLEIELENEKYCTGCVCLTNSRFPADWCSWFKIEPKYNVAGFPLRDKNCPLLKITSREEVEAALEEFEAALDVIRDLEMAIKKGEAKG